MGAEVEYQIVAPGPGNAAVISSPGHWDVQTADTVYLYGLVQHEGEDLCVRSHASSKLTLCFGKPEERQSFDLRRIRLQIVTPGLTLIDHRTSREIRTCIQLASANSTGHRMDSIAVDSCSLEIQAPAMTLGNFIMTGADVVVLNESKQVGFCNQLHVAGRCRFSVRSAESELTQATQLHCSESSHLELNAYVGDVACTRGAIEFGPAASAKRFTSAQSAVLLDVPVESLLGGPPQVLENAARITPRFPQRRHHPLAGLPLVSGSNWRSVPLQYREEQRAWAELVEALKKTHSTGTGLARAREEERRTMRLSLPATSSERWLLSLYSVVGYGQRFLTPLICWVLTVLATASAMVTVGGVRHYDLWRMATLIAAAPMEFLRQPIERPNPPGFGDGFIWVVGKVFGLVFLGAALVAGRRLLASEAK